MFTKDEKKKYTTDFWNSFGLYMKKYNKDFGRIKWVNYRTNVKDIYFRLNMDNQKASVSIELQHKDDGIRSLIFEQFKELKVVLEDNFNGELSWNEVTFNHFNQPISSISEELQNVSIYNRDDWQKVFQFYELRMVGLHTFWTEFQEIFKDLEK